jgi:PBSX family phage terminase large subunit
VRDLTNSFPLSQKYIDFVNTTQNVSADFLEGTTASGKTTVGAGIKFMRMVSESPKKLHIIASKTTGTAEKNIIQQDNGILDLHRNAQYFGNGDKDNKLPHIKFEGKIIYVLGYDNKDKWQNVLGSQFGCVYIDEINTADIEFVREISTRNDYLMATLNPDDPSLPVYREFVNRSRPYKKYAADVPAEIMKELKEEPVPGWRYWFFSFRDNLSLTAEDIEKKKAAAPKGTKLYKNKILGLRGRATGLVFDLQDKNIITLAKAKELKFVRFSAALDTAYSQSTPDTIAFIFIGITADRKCVVLDERVYNNADLKTPISPSDIPPEFVRFLEANRKLWGFARDVYIDSADQATITECMKYKRLTGCIYSFIPAFKKTKIIDRIHLQASWLAAGDFLVLDTCKNYIAEMNIYSWKEDKYEPEDGHDHCINSCQYSWLPYKSQIGSVKLEI